MAQEGAGKKLTNFLSAFVSRTMMPQLKILDSLSLDGRLLFIGRILRMFAYGFLSIILVIYLTELRLNNYQIGLLLTLTLVGDVFISLWLTVVADRLGRKKMLILGAALIIFAGTLFALTNNIYLLILAATIGVISPSGNEIGPFLAIEQAALSQVCAADIRTKVFAWYNLAGSFATALGALCSGGAVQLLKGLGFNLLSSCRMIVISYAAFGVVLSCIFYFLSSKIEVQKTQQHLKPASGIRGWLGLHNSARVVFKLAMLFALDAFAGGFVMQSIIAFWFHLRFGIEPAMLGGIFGAANVLAGCSALIAVKIAARIGLIKTMVFTHVPSNILLIMVPFMPNAFWAVVVLLLRFSISQMDVPTRQSYTMAVVKPEERSVASGITNVARTLGASMSPLFLPLLLGSASTLGICFFTAGGLKIVYDVLLYKSFKSIKPIEERTIKI